MEGGAEGEVGEGGAGFKGEREGGAEVVSRGAEVEKEGVARKGEGEVVVDEEGQVVRRWDGVSPEDVGMPLFHSFFSRL